MTYDIDAVDLFGGPGGWAEGLRRIGLRDYGLEIDDAACRTREAAGHAVWKVDVSVVDPRWFRGVRGLIASPPCPKFSDAGDGSGKEHIPALCEAVRRGDWSARPSDDPLVWLCLEIGRYVEAIETEWIALEQVRAVLPIWEAYADWLRVRGYSVWTGMLNSADYGVPQTRRRAVLMASRTKHVDPPLKTHRKIIKRPSRLYFPGDLQPWVSMADALGWNEEDSLSYMRGAGIVERHGQRPDLPATQPAPTLTATGLGGGGGAKFVHLRSSALRTAALGSADEPAPTVLGSWDNGDARWLLDRRQQSNGVAVRRDPANEPSPTITTIAGSKSQWVWVRPATTVQADPRIGRPGHKDRAGGESQFAEDSVKVTLEEALVLQSFSADYPIQGNRTEAWIQVGNVVPPGLAAPIVARLAF